MGEVRNAREILVGKHEGTRPLGRPRRRWDDNIKIDLREIVWEGVDWSHLAQNRDQWRALVNMVRNIPVSPDFFKIHSNIILPSMLRSFSSCFISPFQAFHSLRLRFLSCECHTASKYEKLIGKDVKSSDGGLCWGSLWT